MTGTGQTYRSNIKLSASYIPMLYHYLSIRGHDGHAQLATSHAVPKRGYLLTQSAYL